MACFHLLRLPTVTLKEVLKCFTPIELYHLSKLSRKMVQLVPLAGTKKILLDINVENFEISMNNEYKFQFKHYFDYINTEPNTFTFIFSGVPHAEKVDQLKILGFYISALFKCPIKSLTFYLFISSGHCRSIIEEIISKQDGSLENLKLFSHFEDEDLKWILEKANVTGNLYIRTAKHQNFSADLKLNCRQFFLPYACWFTIDNLVSLTSCVFVELLCTNLTYQDLNIFMEKWKSGMFSNLEYLMMESESLKNDGQICGFSKKQLEAKKSFVRRKIVGNDNFKICNRGVDVRNDDGINGSIQMISNKFQLFVWKD